MKDRAQDCLQRQFGFSQYRGQQEEAILAALAGRSSLVMMPTGMGKSLCYQLPSCLLPGTVLVVSPLIALMQDQVDKARQKGLRASFINSSLRASQRQERLGQLSQGAYQLLYVTPERFRKPEFVEALRQVTIPLLAVDEAHCISQWGHDFRPDYGRLGEFRAQMGEPPTMALTATATPQVREDIFRQLGLGAEDCLVFKEGVRRPNLYLEVESVHGLEEKLRRLVGLIHQSQGPMIVYFQLISSLEKVAFELRRLGLSALTYHGQLPQAVRRRHQELFLKGQEPLILATPAFGLGVDKPDVRSLVHMEIPGSIEAYYQEVGRAGRDGRPSRCTLFYDPDDLSISMDFIKWSHPDPGFVRALYNLLVGQIDRVRTEGADYLRGQLNFYNRRDFRLETALNQLESLGSISWPQRDFRQLEVLEDFPEQAFALVDHKNHLLLQNQKLLKLMELVKGEECFKRKIYDYFDEGTHQDCGFCGTCGGWKEAGG